MLTQYQKQIDRNSGKRDIVKKTYETISGQISNLEKEIKHTEKAQAIIQKVAKETQENLSYKLSEIVTLALNSIFDDPYEFNVEFAIKRGKTEVEFLLLKKGNEYHPTNDIGGGVVDILSFALRIVMWSLKKPRTRNVIILDEPFRFLSKDLQPKASLLLEELSEKLNLQFIMVSHSEDLIEGADKVFKAIKRKKITKIKEV